MSDEFMMYFDQLVLSFDELLMSFDDEEVKNDGWDKLFEKRGAGWSKDELEEGKKKFDFIKILKLP